MKLLRGFSELFDDEEKATPGTLPGTMAHLRQVERQKKLRDEPSRAADPAGGAWNARTASDAPGKDSVIPGLSGNPGESPADQTRANRLAMHRLMQKGYSEADALVRVFPGDRKRRRRLNTWKALGLWPVPATELKVEEALENRPASETRDSAPHRLLDSMPGQDWEACMEAIVTRIVGEMVDDLRRTLRAEAHTLDPETPPEPPVTDGKDQNAASARKRKRLTITIDAVLADKFKEEMKHRNFSGSKLADTILWHWYSKPPLSYM